MITIVISARAHGQTNDNVAGVRSGWRDPGLTEEGQRQARQQGLLHANEDFDVIFTSDLRRTYETAALMFEGRQIPIIQDSRLRQLNYGDLEGLPTADLQDQGPKDVDTPFPNGESCVQMVDRFRSFLDDLEPDYDGKRVIIVANRPGIWEHLLNGAPLEDSIAARLLERPAIFEYGPRSQ